MHATGRPDAMPKRVRTGRLRPPPPYRTEYGPCFGIAPRRAQIHHHAPVESIRSTRDSTPMQALHRCRTAAAEPARPATAYISPRQVKLRRVLARAPAFGPARL